MVLRAAARAEAAALPYTARRQPKRVGLGDVTDEPAGSLPLGRQQLVEIVRGLCLNPCTFLLDEPAAGLHLQEKQALTRLLRALRDEGMAILLVERDMDLVTGLADRVAVMDFGDKIANGAPCAGQVKIRLVVVFRDLSDGSGIPRSRAAAPSRSRRSG